MEYRTLIVNTILIGLFVFAMINFGVYLASDNNANVSILNEPIINESYVNIETELDAVKGTAEGQLLGFFKDIPILSEIGIIMNSLIGSARIFTSLVRNVFDIVFTMIESTLGIPPIVTSVITGILIIVTILLIWRMYRNG